jgi:uncharacterized protein
MPVASRVTHGEPLTDDPPYEQGLKFECTRCRQCCQKESGDLFLSALDLRRLAGYLELSDEEFFLEYCEIVDLELAQRVSLVADENGACVFLGPAGCEVYEHRPLQCRAFPFWASNLMDAQSWQQVGETCCGVGRGRLWSREEVLGWVEKRERDPLLDVQDET